MADKICLIFTLLLGMYGAYTWFTFGKPRDPAEKKQKTALLIGSALVILLSILILVRALAR